MFMVYKTFLKSYVWRDLCFHKKNDCGNLIYIHSQRLKMFIIGKLNLDNCNNFDVLVIHQLVIRKLMILN